MKSIQINQKVTLIRHWGRWYNVQRGGEDWKPLQIKRYVKQKSIAEMAEGLRKKYPSALPIPDILDEAAADREVAKNTPRNRNKKKGRG